MKLYVRMKRKNLLKCVKKQTDVTRETDSVCHAIIWLTGQCAAVQMWTFEFSALGHIISSRMVGNAKIFFVLHRLCTIMPVCARLTKSQLDDSEIRWVCWWGCSLSVLCRRLKLPKIAGLLTGAKEGQKKLKTGNLVQLEDAKSTVIKSPDLTWNQFEFLEWASKYGLRANLCKSSFIQSY